MLVSRSNSLDAVFGVRFSNFRSVAFPLPFPVLFLLWFYYCSTKKISPFSAKDFPLLFPPERLFSPGLQLVTPSFMVAPLSSSVKYR